MKESSPAGSVRGVRSQDIWDVRCGAVEMKESSPAGSVRGTRPQELAEAGYTVDDQEVSTTARPMDGGLTAQGACLQALVATDAGGVEEAPLQPRCEGLDLVRESSGASDSTYEGGTLSTPPESPLQMDDKELAAAGSAGTSASPLGATRENLWFLNASYTGVGFHVASSTESESPLPCVSTVPGVTISESNEGFSASSPKAMSLGSACQTAKAMMLNKVAEIAKIISQEVELDTCQNESPLSMSRDLVENESRFNVGCCSHSFVSTSNRVDESRDLINKQATKSLTSTTTKRVVLEHSGLS